MQKKLKRKLIKLKKFSYSIKVADFYYRDTAEIMLNKIKKAIPIRESKYN